MPRTARGQCESGIHHVMLRGINREDIFHDEEDRQRFLSALAKGKEISQYEMFAWCLMDNHVHLLVRAGEEPLGTAIKRVGCRYVYWFNRKYNRVGHLFQDRYRSEAVQSEAYFLTALRYILQNPIKAGMEQRMGQYPYSSFGAYCGHPDGMTDTAFATGFFESGSALRAFLEQRADDGVMDMPAGNTPVRDEDVVEWLAEAGGDGALGKLDKNARRQCVRLLHQRGATVRQIAAATQLPKSNIGRLIK